MTQCKCRIIGITGGIGTGKSTVSKILKNKDYKIIDADKIARKIMEVGSDAYIKVIEEFGENILFEDEKLNRKALANIIFNDDKARKKLDNITHPYIFESIKSNLEKICQNEKVVFLDIPLLFEQYQLWNKYDIIFDEILLVDTDEETQVNRIKARDKISKVEALKKIRSQLNMDEKRRKSSKIIDNSGDYENLEKQLEKLLLEII